MRTKIIGLAGKAGAGKSTVAKILTSPKSAGPCGAELLLASPIKDAVVGMGLFPRSVVYGPSERRNTAHATLGFTAREALQTLGTEWGRALHPDIWARLGVERALAMLACPDITSHVVISDVRFVNEARAITEAGGEVWRVYRDGAGLTGAAALHPSETEMDSLDFARLVSRRVFNHWDLDVLQIGVREHARSAGVSI